MRLLANGLFLKVKAPMLWLQPLSGRKYSVELTG